MLAGGQVHGELPAGREGPRKEPGAWRGTGRLRGGASAWAPLPVSAEPQTGGGGGCGGESVSPGPGPPRVETSRAAGRWLMAVVLLL